MTNRVQTFAWNHSQCPFCLDARDSRTNGFISVVPHTVQGDTCCTWTQMQLFGVKAREDQEAPNVSMCTSKYYSLSLSLSLTLHDMPCLCSFDAICQYVHAPDQLVWCERFVVPWSDTAIAAILQSKFISDRSGQIEFVERIGIALTALGFQTGRGWVSHVCWDWSEKTHLLCAWQDQISWIPSRSN